MVKDKDLLGKASNKLTEYGKTGAVYTKNMVVNVTEKRPILGLIIILILAIVVILLVENAINGLVGFFSTPTGIIVLLMLFGAVGLYIYLRSLGIKLNGWLGAMIEISLLFIFIVAFMGSSQVLAGFFMMAMPFIILGAILYFFYRGVQEIKSEELKAFAVAMAVMLVIVIAVSNMFIVPYFTGEQKILEIDVTNTDRQSSPVVVDINMHNLFQTMTLTTSLNPYIIELYSLSTNMWVFKYKEYIVSYKVIDVNNNYKVLAYSPNNYLYVKDTAGQTATLYAIIQLPPKTSNAFNYEVVVDIYNMNHMLILHKTYSYYGLET